MRGRVGLVAALGEDEFAAMEGPESSLDGALRESRLLRDLVVTEARLFRALPRDPAPEEEIDDEGGGTVVMPDEVAEEHVDDVTVEAEEGHGYSSNYYSRF
jgi:hypothetical protein